MFEHSFDRVSLYRRHKKLVGGFISLLLRVLTKFHYLLSRAKWAVIGVMLTAITMLSIFTYFLLYTQSGVQFLFKTLTPLSGYTIQYDKLSGTLSNQSLDIEGLHLQSSDFDLYAKSLNVKMSFFKLLFKKMDIQALRLDSPTIIKSNDFTELPSNFDKTLKEWINKIEQNEDLSWQTLFSNYSGYAFSVDKLDINDLHFVSGKQHYDVKTFILTHLHSKNKYLFSSMKIIMPEINLEAKLSEKINVNWDIQIQELNQYVRSLKGDLRSIGQWNNHSNQPLSLNFRSKKLILNEIKTENIRLDIRGKLKEHHLSLAFDQNKAKFLTELTGQFEHMHDYAIWQGQIKKLFYEHPSYKNIQPSLGKFKLWFSPEKSTLSLHFDLLGQNHFTVESALSHQDNLNLTGKIVGEINDLKLLSLFTDLEKIREVGTLNGKGHLTLSLQGTLIHPEYVGEVVFTDFYAKLPKLNIAINLNQVGFYDLGTPKIHLKASGKIGQGHFELEGFAKKDLISPTLNLTLKGTNLLISNTDEYKVTVSPHLRLDIDKNTALLSGQVQVPEAKITPKDKRDTIVASEDVVLIKNNKRVENASSDSIQTLKKLKTNVEIIFGDGIFFEGYGLKTKATGHIKIESRQDNTSKATGKINLVNGRYGAYGHYFSLSYGQLLFQSDPILNPKVDIRAQRTIQPNMRIKNNATVREDVVVGMQITGTIAKLNTQLYSNPPMSEKDIISYLILGHGLNKNSGAEGEVVMEAISQLTRAFYPKSKHSTEKKSFYDRLKLDWNIGQSPFDDEVGDAPSDFQKKYVNIGKRLSDKLYIQYSLGLADKVSVYSIQYLLGHHVVLEAKTDSQNRTAADLLFTFESS